MEALRGTVRFLRMDNTYLKGHDLLREIETLPPLPHLSDTHQRLWFLLGILTLMALILNYHPRQQSCFRCLLR